jgi:hypothetical protein
MDDRAKVNGGIGSGPDFANAIHGRSLAIAVIVGISRVAAVGSVGGAKRACATVTLRWETVGRRASGARGCLQTDLEILGVPDRAQQVAADAASLVRDLR